MKLLRYIKHSLFLPDEYVCMDGSEILNSVKVILASGNKLIDVTRTHLFLGYRPLTIGFPKNTGFDPDREIKLEFHTQDKLHGTIEMKIIQSDHPSLWLYTAAHARHHFLSFTQKTVSSLKAMLHRRNASLYPEGNSYDQIRVAYSFPRIISLVIVRKNNLINIFPTDLHGKISGTDRYMISLRENGKALEQVLSADQISLHSMPPESYKMVYSLGKNHMADLKPINDFNTLLIQDALLNKLLIPLNSRYSRQLKYESRTLSGIHHLLEFSMMQRESYDNTTGNLAHVHSWYALWRRRQNLKDRLLIRN